MNQRLISGTVRVVAFSAAMLLLTMLVVTRSQAAFTATTSTNANFKAADLDLSDDDRGAALFTAQGMIPGHSVEECIAVTYDGDTTPVPVRMYGTASGQLAGLIDLTVQVGTGGSSAGCGGFSSSATIYDGTLAGFAGAHSSWANGQAVWTATGAPSTRTLKFTATVQDDDAAQGTSATAGFTWETRTS